MKTKSFEESLKKKFIKQKYNQQKPKRKKYKKNKNFGYFCLF